MIKTLFLSICGISFTSAHNHNHSHDHSHDHTHVHTSSVQLINPAIINTISTFMQNKIFIFDPFYNSLISTTLIQLIPFTFICLSPIDFNITIMVAFAIGTLFGEIFLHLIPESNPNTIGLGMFLGTMTFLCIDKTVRIFTYDGKSSHGHSHSHSHSHSHNENKSEKTETVAKPSIFLSVITALIHNITDGITIATSFYKSVPIGIITMIAFLFHELPHQLSDYAIITKTTSTAENSKLNFFKKSVMWSILGSWIGTGLSGSINEGILAKQSNQIDDYLVPFSAGGLIYIAAVNVLPEILESPQGKTKYQLVFLWMQQLSAIIFGFYIMSLMAD